MNEADLRRLIKQEISIALQVISSGTTSKADQTTEDIASLFPGLTTLVGRPIVRPYGFVSRAPAGTISATAQQGNHPGNKLTIGHRDAKAPGVNVGESAMYSLAGFKVWCEGNRVSVGKGSVVETLVVGETLAEFLTAFLNHIIAHTHIGNLGAPTSTPINADDFTNILNEYIANGKILAKDGGRF